jgi:tetratricopeptide (TPR) repeat protein/LysM repeat protein
MSERQACWLLKLAAAAGLAMAGQPALAATAPSAPIEISTFSGAYLAARVAEDDNDLEGAIAYYKKALAFDPENQPLQQSLMLALISNGRFDEALPYAEKLKTVAEVERFSRLALAVDTLRKKDYKAAERWLKLALESDLDTLVSQVMTAWARLGAGEQQRAFEVLDKLAGPEWYGLFVSYHRALIADAAGLKTEAEAAYKAATDDMGVGGAAPETWLRAAEAYAGFLARGGRKDDALGVLARADEFSAGRVPIAALRDKINAGAAVAPMVASPAEGASELVLNLATALNRGGGEPYVRLYLQYALALKPDSDAVLVELAAVAEQQEDAEEAIALYRRIPASSPLKRLSELQLGLNLADLDRHDEAISQLERLVDANPDDMRAYLALGGVYSSKEDYVNSGKVYDRAVARIDAKKAELPNVPEAATNWNIYYQRGIAFERQKQWAKAEPNFRKALALFPNQPQVLNYLGYSWIDMNMNLEEGMDMIRKAVDLRPSDGYIVDSLGWAHYRLGEFEDAVRELERAVSLKPDDAVLNDHLGDAYWRAGRRLEATFQWNHARDLKPEPDILAGVLKKLAEGLPPVENKTAAEAPSKTSAPVVEEPAPATPEKRTEMVPPAASEKPVPAAYKVQRGQSLWSIAADELGSGSRYKEILDLNPQLQANPSYLMPGQELTLPGGAN